MARAELRQGALSVAPLIPGVVPFGMVTGAAVADAGLGLTEALGLSMVLFAGASQLALLDVLGNGGAVLVAVASAWVINLRFLLYSTSLAVHAGELSLPQRLGMGYLLTDQAFAVGSSGIEERPARSTFWIYLGAGLAMWTTWQVASVLGFFVGDRVPDDVPLEFMIPLLFLAMVLPSLVDRATITSAVVGGGGAVVAAELGAGGRLAPRRRGGGNRRRHPRPAMPRVIEVSTLWVAVLVAAAGTFAIRAVPLAAAERLAGLPVGARQALRMIAPAALSALVALAVLRPGGDLTLVGDRTVAAIAGGLVGWRTRNVLATMLVGMAVLLALDAW